MLTDILNFLKNYDWLPQELVIIILASLVMYVKLEYDDYKLRKQERLVNAKKTKKTTY